MKTNPAQLHFFQGLQYWKTNQLISILHGGTHIHKIHAQLGPLGISDQLVIQVKQHALLPACSPHARARALGAAGAVGSFTSLHSKKQRGSSADL